MSISYSSSAQQSSFQLSVTALKQQLREERQRGIVMEKQHKVQLGKKDEQIKQLRERLLEMKQQEYMKELMGEEDREGERREHVKVMEENYDMKKHLHNVTQQLSQTRTRLQTLTNQNLSLKSTLCMIQKQKQKHLQISITEKIQLENKLQLLQKEILVKDKLIQKLKLNQPMIKEKQMQNQQLQKTLTNKIKEIEFKENQLQQYSAFECQNLKKQLNTIVKENQWLKEHLKKTNQKHYLTQNTNKAYCNNPQCLHQLELYKNKYLQSMKQLSKLKTEINKELFKETLTQKRQHRENNQIKQTKSHQHSLKSSYAQSHTGKENKEHQQIDDYLYFNLTENDEQPQVLIDSNKPKQPSMTTTLASYQSEMLAKRSSTSGLR